MHGPLSSGCTVSSITFASHVRVKVRPVRGRPRLDASRAGEIDAWREPMTEDWFGQAKINGFG
jgi:hypothetical protein